MAIALQGVLYSYLRQGKLDEMMNNVVMPARNVTIDDLESWMTEYGFMQPEVGEEESEDYKVVAQIIHIKRPDLKKPEKTYVIKNQMNTRSMPKTYSLADQNSRVVILR